eukprot:COSAG01_NODE_69678_length_260_cov_1.900621_1_plen_65_part_10
MRSPHARISSERCSFSHVKSFVGAAAITRRIPEYEGLTLALQAHDLLGSDRPWCVCACAQVGWAP